MQIIKPKLLFFLLSLTVFFPPIKLMADTVYIIGCFPDYTITSHHNAYVSYTDEVKNCDLFSQFTISASSTIDPNTNGTSNPQLSNISITKGIDTTSPFLFSSMVTQELVSLKLFIYKINSGSELKKLSEISVENALVKEIDSGFEGNAENLYDTENLSLSFQKIEFKDYGISSSDPNLIQTLTSCLDNQNKDMFTCAK